MNHRLHTISNNPFEDKISLQTQEATSELESGKVLYFPQLPFLLHDNENGIFNALILDGKHKNVGFHPQKNQIGGLAPHVSVEMRMVVQAFMERFALFAKNLVNTVLPHYTDHLEWGRTSYRPIEIEGRKSSKRKDDTRLHVDAFPASPVNGKRILRVFSNIHPGTDPRVWHLGEPFADVVKQFAPTVPPYKPTVAKILQWIKATKSLRSEYDHYMLHMHDNMKLDDHYQEHVLKDRFDFPAQTTWIVFTDHVSHAALRGQYLLEQTFYLASEKMLDQEKAPFFHIQNIKNLTKNSQKKSCCSCG